MRRPPLERRAVLPRKKGRLARPTWKSSWALPEPRSEATNRWHGAQERDLRVWPCDTSTSLPPGPLLFLTTKVAGSSVAFGAVPKSRRWCAIMNWAISSCHGFGPPPRSGLLLNR